MPRPLRVGSLVAHYPEGDPRLSSLFDAGVIPEPTPDFRVGMIIEEKPGHLLIYYDDSRPPCWYTHQELKLLS